MKKHFKWLSVALSAILMMNFISISAYAEVDLSAELTTIGNLISQCEAKGIATDYEKVNYETIKKFADFDDTNAERKAYNDAYLAELCQTTKTTLQAYLNGSEAPFSAKLPDIESLYIDENMLRDENGPVYSVGYGHFNEARNDVAMFNNVGATNIQVSVNPNSLTGEGVVGWTRNDSGDPIVTMDFSSEHVSGAHSLHIKNESIDTGNLYARLEREIDVKPNTSYEFGCKTKGAVGTEENIWISMDGWNSDRYTLDLSSTEWKDNNFTYTMPNRESDGFMIISNGVCEGWIDDIYLYELDSSNQRVGDNLLTNADFEDTDRTKGDLEYLLNTLEQAEKNNVAVSLLLETHDLADTEGIESEQSGFIKIKIFEEKAKTQIKEFIEAVIPYVKGYKALNNICLSNEPVFNTLKESNYYNALYQQYLEEVHGTVANLNKARPYSLYTAFSSVNMNNNNERNTYDWINFNNKILTEWHKWMADIVNEITGGKIPVHAKMMGYFNSLVTNTESVNSNDNCRGTDLEMFASFSQLAGNDAWDKVSEGDTYYAEMFLYDYQSSVTGLPVYNSEDHIIIDEEAGAVDAYTARLRSHVANNVWQGAVHGRNMSTIWVWERGSAELDGSILYRPDCMVAVGKTSLDLARLNNKVASLREGGPKAAIYYSTASKLFDTEYSASLLEAYKTLLNNGIKVGIVSDSSIEKLSEYDYLVIPGAKYGTSEALTAIADFARGGNKVYYTGNIFMYNEYKKTLGGSALTNEANAVSYLGDAGLANLINESGMSRVTLKKAGTEDAPTGLDWQYTTNGNELLINITNLSETDQELEIYVDGEKISGYSEYITGETKLSSVTAATDTPQLISYVSSRVSEPVDERIELTNNKTVIGEGSVSCNLKIKNLTNGLLPTVIAVKCYNAAGSLLNYAYNFKTCAASSVGIWNVSIPINGECARVEISAVDSLEAENLYADRIIVTK